MFFFFPPETFSASNIKLGMLLVICLALLGVYVIPARIHVFLRVGIVVLVPQCS